MSSKPTPMALPPRQPVKGRAVASVASIEPEPAAVAAPPLVEVPSQVAQPAAALQPSPQEVVAPEPAPPAATPVAQPASIITSSPPPLPPNVKALGGTIAVTVRMDQPTYERLKMYGVRTRQTNQDIVLNAIKATLDAGVIARVANRLNAYVSVCVLVSLPAYASAHLRKN